MQESPPGIHTLDEDRTSSSQEEWVSMVNTGKDAKVIKCRMVVGGTEVVFQVDPGALPTCYHFNMLIMLMRMIVCSRCGTTLNSALWVPVERV